jgi:hypothetical protein
VPVLIWSMSASRIGSSVRIFVTDTESGTWSTAERIVFAASFCSSTASGSMPAAVSGVFAQYGGRETAVSSVSRECCVVARSMASARARSACSDPSTQTRMLWNMTTSLRRITWHAKQ